MNVAYLKDYKPHKNQLKFHQACADKANKTIIIISSIRSGKSLSLINEIIKDSWNASMPSDTGNLVCAPYYRQTEEILEQPIVEKLQRCGLLQEHNYSKHRTILKNGNKIYFRSLDNYDSIRGLNVWNAYVDEGAMVSREAIDVVRGRLLTHNGKLVIASTPKGFNNYLYEDYFAPNSTKSFTRIKYNLRDNPLITEEAIFELRSNYDEKTAQQELDGEFVALTENAVYYAFSDNNIKPLPQPDRYAYKLYVGVDYNIGINAYVVCQKINNIIYVYDEGYGSATTSDLGRDIVSKYDPINLIVIDDTSGNSRQQADGVTNRQVLQQCGIRNISSNTSNPKREARFANTNAWLKNALGKNRLFIDPKCKKLIAELREYTYKKNSVETDDRYGKVGHLTDALGYVVYQLSGGSIPPEKIVR